jgi:Uma2 family endonuclease
MPEALAKKLFYSKEEYLEMETAAEYKSEYYNGEVFAMSGGSYKHSVICVNLIWGIRESVANKDCTAFESNMKLDIPKFNLFVYPDVMAVCGDIEFFENRTDTIRNPILVIEVASPGTQSFDRIQKFAYYRSVPSVKEYVLVSQDEPLIETYYKQNEKIWIYTVARGFEDTITFRTIECELELREIYRKAGWNQIKAELI